MPASAQGDCRAIEAVVPPFTATLVLMVITMVDGTAPLAPTGLSARARIGVIECALGVLGNVVAGLVAASLIGASDELHSRLTFPLKPTSGISVSVTLSWRSRA